VKFEPHHGSLDFYTGIGQEKIVCEDGSQKHGDRTERQSEGSVSSSPGMNPK
jgi:hypothetical protein